MNSKEHFTHKNARTGMIATIWILAGVTLTLIAVITVAVRREKDTRAMLMYQYDRALSDMSNAVATSEEYLLKALAAGSAQKTAEMLQEAARASAYAEGSMALLPLSAEVAGEISNYLVQVDDLAKVWASAAISDELKSSQVQLDQDSVEASADGKPTGWAGFTDENYTLLQELHGYSLDLSASLTELANRVTDNGYSWSKIQADADELLAHPFQDYPTLNYDGQYSDHMKHLTAKGVSGQIIGQEQGAEQVRLMFEKLLAEKPTVTFSGEQQLNGIDLYHYTVTFSGKDDRQAYVALTKRGGTLCNLTFYAKDAEEKLTTDQCAQAGTTFLKGLGIDKMALVQTEPMDGAVLLHFCCLKDGVYYYSDAIQVKVSAATGQVIGYDAYKYLMYHCVRQTPDSDVSVISQSQAKAKINAKLTIEDVRTCYLDNVYGSEDYFYEFRCTGLGHEFLIYVDAKTGAEARIEIVS